ncbi:MAG: NAD(+) kinase [Sinobacterium sp.]|nr:NAD(+) kinase [Sinobacterium sp.]
MEAQFRVVGIIGRPGNDNGKVIESVKVLKRFLLSQDISVILADDLAKVLPAHGLQVLPRKIIGETCDLVIVVGGDGSMLGAARDLASQGVPVLGINRGGLGFLTDISPDEIEEKVAEVLAGKYTVESRFLLDTIIKRNGEPISKGSAFNDIVVSSGETARMMSFELEIEGQFVYSQRSDGLIVSTPTGSTAYSLSAGGPIMHPTLDALCLVPMFPHSLNARPIMIDGNAEIKIRISEDTSTMPTVTCDGHLNLKARPGDVVYIYKKPHKLKLIHPMDHSFYSACRDKLGWGDKLVN